MSAIKINTANELKKFLELVASEAVRKSLNESPEFEEDDYQSFYTQSLEKDKDYYNLKEEDDPSVDEEEPAEEEAPTEEPEEKKNDTSSKTFGASFDSLIRAINKLRSGKSTKDSLVRDQAAVYYERLNEAEREVLVLFMKEMASILTGEIEGSEAQDPDSDPLNISVEKEEGESAAQMSQAAAPEEEDNEKGEEPEQQEEEDISPPIKVNESQDDYHLRMKIRELMSR